MTTNSSIRHTVVFRQGEDDYHTYRIPSIVRALDGTLVAIVEGRRDRGSDPGGGHIDLCYKLSQDGGDSWSERRFLDLVPEGWGASNPTAVVERASGRLIVVFNRWQPGRGGRNSRPGTLDNQLWLRRSDDHGRSWSEAVDITAQGRDIQTWGQAVPGPGHGIQTAGGRLVIPVNAPCLPADPAHPERSHGLSTAAADRADESGPAPARTSSFALYSDDGGHSWRRGRPNGRFTTESQIVELEDGRLMMDARQKDAVPHRWVAFGDDGGESWSEPRPGQVLTQICAAVGRCQLPGGGSVLVWSGLRAPASAEAPAAEQRRDLVVRLSRDQGRSFPVERLIGPGPAAYSDLAILEVGVVGVLWEGGGDHRYEKVTFTRVPLSALI